LESGGVVCDSISLGTLVSDADKLVDSIVDILRVSSAEDISGIVK
jgi:hypothetical protein